MRAEHDRDMDLRWLTSAQVEEVVAASRLFDYEVSREWAQTFLDESTHHLCIAYQDEVPAGFVSGIEMTHPDKGTEMFLYELGVDQAFRRRGIGRMLVAALADRACSNGCYGMWVLTDRANRAAVSTYTAAGATDESTQLMLSWRFIDAHPKFVPGS